MWRTVKDHGQPGPDDLPVLFDAPHGLIKHGVLHEKGQGFGQGTTQWMPVAELLTLPEAPPPPRMVMIELAEDYARQIARTAWDAPVLRSVSAACRDAIAELDGGDDD